MNKDRLDLLLGMKNNDPNDSFISYAVAKEYENLGLLDEALDTYLSLKTSDPSYVGLYYHLGKLYEEIQNFEQALIAYQEGIDIAKKIPDFHALSELNNAKLNLEMEM